MKQLIAPLVLLSLCACATPKAITATEQGITVDIDNTGFTDGEAIRKGAKIAEEHCAKYGKKANLERTTGAFGAAQVAYFNCT